MNRPLPTSLRRPAQSAFTLIELVVVMAIIATLASLILPAVQQAREGARRTQCTFGVRQLVAAMLEYHQSNGSLPAGWHEASEVAGLPPGQLPNSGFGWGAVLLPALDRTALHQKVNFQAPLLGEADRDPDEPGDQNNETIIARQPLPTFRCPSSTAPRTANNANPAGAVLIADQATSSYIACYGSDDVPDETTLPILGTGAFARNSAVNLSNIVDGESYTILVGERNWHGLYTADDTPQPGDAYWAGTPDSWLSDVLGTTGVSMNSGRAAEFGSGHPGGAVFGFADGRVLFLNENIESFPGEASGPHMGLYQKLGHIHDGQTIGDF